MIFVIAGAVHAFDLLPYFLKHYRDLGVDKFLISCRPDDLDPRGDLRRFLEEQPDVTAVDLPRSFRRSSLVGMVEEETRAAMATADDWIIPADLDEFNQYPENLPVLVEKFETEGFTHVMGNMRDRLAANGELSQLRPFADGITIWEQFPLEANVTKRVVGGRTDKVLLSRGDLRLGIGHHQMRDALRPYPEKGVAHHFKWRDGLLRNLAWRVEHELASRVPWSSESIRLSDYLEQHGRIQLEDVDAAVGWHPERAAAHIGEE